MVFGRILATSLMIFLMILGEFSEYANFAKSVVFLRKNNDFQGSEASFVQNFLHFFRSLFVIDFWVYFYMLLGAVLLQFCSLFLFFRCIFSTLLRHQFLDTFLDVFFLVFGVVSNGKFICG